MIDRGVNKINSQVRINYLLTAIFLISLIARYLSALSINSPGHADPAYYYSVAENLYNGRGFQIDYIWHFLKKWPQLTHPSNDYWMPLNSILIFFAFKIFGLSMFNALIPNIILGSLLPIIIYIFAKELIKDNNIALIAAILASVNTNLFVNSFSLETIIPFVFFAGIAFILIYRTIIQQSHTPYLWIMLGFFLAICHLTRQDAFILIITIHLLFIYLKIRKYNLSWRYLLLTDSFYLICMSPWLIRNYYALGQIFPAYLLKGLFLKTYEALFSYDFAFTGKEFFELGVGRILYLKISQLANGLNLLFSKDVLPLLVFIYLGLIVNRNKPRLAPFAIYFFLFIVFTLITPFSLNVNTLPSLLLFIIPLASQGLALTTEAYNKSLAFSKKAIFFSIMSILVIYNIVLIGFDIKAKYRADQKIYKEYSKLKSYFEQRHKAKEVIIMTRNPWEVYYFTKVKCIQVPYENLEAVMNVAKIYKVSHLLLPVERHFLRPIYEGYVRDKKLVFEYQVPDSDLRLFTFVE